MKTEKILIANQSFTKSEIRKLCGQIVEDKQGQELAGFDYELARWCLYQIHPELDKSKEYKIRVNVLDGSARFEYYSDDKIWKFYSFRKATMSYGENYH